MAGDGTIDKLDWLNLAEEIEALAKRDRRELASHIGVAAEHLMKLMASPAIDPRLGWSESIVRARGEIALILADSPSLVGALPDMVERMLARARKNVGSGLSQHGETPRVPLDALIYTPEQITGDWWPA